MPITTGLDFYDNLKPMKLNSDFFIHSYNKLLEIVDINSMV